MAKGKKNINRSRADLLKTTEEEEKSVFSSIVLKEKKVELKPKKASEIVKGYDPNASFADILYNYEHTGDPYAMPKKKKVSSAPSSFGAILDKWEGKDKKPEVKKEVKKSQYKATRSFEDILNEYETPKNQSKKAKDRHVSSVLNTKFEKPAEKAAAEEKKANEVKKEEEIPAPPTFFKKMEEGDERPESVAWSVFGDNKEIIREVKANEERKEGKEHAARKSEYVPTKDFGEILSDFDNHKKAPRKKEERKEKSGKERAVENPDARNNTTTEKNESEIFKNAVDQIGAETFEEIMKKKGEEREKPKDKSLSELRSMIPQSTLDLHGLYAADAEKAINNFIDDAISSGIEKVAIIHGKGLHSQGGETVLKDLTARIINERHVARETRVAPASQGGSGVLWIILKKRAE